MDGIRYVKKTLKILSVSARAPASSLRLYVLDLDLLQQYMNPFFCFTIINKTRNMAHKNYFNVHIVEKNYQLFVQANLEEVEEYNYKKELTGKGEPPGQVPPPAMGDEEYSKGIFSLLFLSIISSFCIKSDVKIGFGDNKYLDSELLFGSTKTKEEEEGNKEKEEDFI
ncbi:hypothetical protein Mgra_00002683 [Meloidogyne graminicola]|uniref:Uncharacterized protein n=1 Tax=Meloidogyne graminicola TaxID=189291 RepID=A0A8S9ZWD4_9BILA|nr:hypothetical protein Mgra_00002683 [Meloidogyne graminicola]